MAEPEYGSANKTSINVKLPPADSDNASQYGGSVSDNLLSSRPEPEQPKIGPPQNTPAGGSLSSTISMRKTLNRSTEKTHREAARIIERAWLKYRDRQMFQLLKNSVCAAEHSLSYEVLRKVSPKEAEFFKDPSCNIRVRFRFGGSEFPPEIFFKVYLHSESAQIKYITGKKVLTSDSEAAREALELMGARKFYEIILQDAVHHQQNRITDEIDITTSKDYMQYLSIVDETPAYLGGKENYWRRLTLASLPRTTIFYDLLEFAYHRPSRMTPRLRRELPALMARPVTQAIQRHQIQILSQVRTPLVVNDGAPAPPKSRLHSELMDSTRSTGRRSKMAQQRTARMRKMYEEEKEKAREGHHREVTFMTEDDDREEEAMRQNTAVDTEWEDEEAQKLYHWSQQLPMGDINTPRHSRMMSGIL